MFKKLRFRCIARGIMAGVFFTLVLRGICAGAGKLEVYDTKESWTLSSDSIEMVILKSPKFAPIKAKDLSLYSWYGIFGRTDFAVSSVEAKEEGEAKIFIVKGELSGAQPSPVKHVSTVKITPIAKGVKIEAFHQFEANESIKNGAFSIQFASLPKEYCGRPVFADGKEEVLPEGKPDWSTYFNASGSLKFTTPAGITWTFSPVKNCACYFKSMPEGRYSIVFVSSPWAQVSLSQGDKYEVDYAITIEEQTK